MIDWARIRELREEVGEDDFEEVVELFLEEVQCALDRLKTLTSRDTLEQDLHFLKGSALSLGFTAFSVLCQTGERLSSQGRADEVELREIFDCFEESNKVFMSEYADRLAA